MIWAELGLTRVPVFLFKTASVHLGSRSLRASQRLTSSFTTRGKQVVLILIYLLIGSSLFGCCWLRTRLVQVRFNIITNSHYATACNNSKKHQNHLKDELTIRKIINYFLHFILIFMD